MFAWWVAQSAWADNIPWMSSTRGGTEELMINQKLNGGQWVSLGVYSFNAGTGGSVLVRNAGTNGIVVADAVRFFAQ